MLLLAQIASTAVYPDLNGMLIVVSYIFLHHHIYQFFVCLPCRHRPRMQQAALTAPARASRTHWHSRKLRHARALPQSSTCTTGAMPPPSAHQAGTSAPVRRSTVAEVQREQDSHWHRQRASLASLCMTPITIAESATISAARHRNALDTRVAADVPSAVAAIRTSRAWAAAVSRGRRRRACVMAVWTVATVAVQLISAAVRRNAR